MPPTIYDRGTWQFESQLLSLRSDHTVPQKDFPHDSRFVPVYYSVSGQRTLLLMGTTWNLTYFKEHATTNDDFMLFLCTFTRIEGIDTGQAEALRNKMYAESWKPEFFK